MKTSGPPAKPNIPHHSSGSELMRLLGDAEYDKCKEILIRDYGVNAAQAESVACYIDLGWQFSDFGINDSIDIFKVGFENVDTGYIREDGTFRYS